MNYSKNTIKKCKSLIANGRFAEADIGEANLRMLFTYSLKREFPEKAEIIGRYFRTWREPEGGKHCDRCDKWVEDSNNMAPHPETPSDIVCWECFDKAMRLEPLVNPPGEFRNQKGGSQ